MSNKTQAELATQVLRDLNVIDASESADSEDSTYVMGKYASKYEELLDRELCYWPLDAIPNAIFIPVCDLVANEVRSTFGELQSPEDKLAREDTVLRQIRRHMQKRASGLPVKATYF